nr:MAG: ORF3 [Torque teno polar bear virus 32]
MRELLEALSEPKKDWWRSSPALFSSGDESDDGYTGRMKRKRLPSSPGVSETPSHGSHCEDDLSGIWSSPPTDDDDDGDWEVWDDDDDFKNKPRGGWNTPPPDTPPDHNEIYEMLRELDNKGELD